MLIQGGEGGYNSGEKMFENKQIRKKLLHENEKLSTLS